MTLTVKLSNWVGLSTSFQLSYSEALITITMLQCFIPLTSKTICTQPKFLWPHLTLLLGYIKDILSLLMGSLCIRCNLNTIKILWICSVNYQIWFCIENSLFQIGIELELFPFVYSKTCKQAITTLTRLLYLPLLLTLKSNLNLRSKCNLIESCISKLLNIWKKPY